MIRILVLEPLSAGDPATTQALGRGSAAHLEMLAAGRAMRDAMAADLSALAGIAVTVAVAQQEAGHPLRGVRTIAPLAGEAAVDLLRRQAPLHDLCWVVAPESDDLLLRMHQAVGDARWIGCNERAIRLAASKRATCEVLAHAGLLTPRAFAARHRGGWIVKPDDGAGTMETRRHATRAAAEADLRERLHAGGTALMEPFVSGEPLSIAMIVGPEIARPIAFNRQCLDIDADGWLHDVGVQPAAVRATDPRIASLRSLAAGVAAAMPGLRGYVGIDVVWNERKGPVVIEVNPRVTCAYVGLSGILHRNLAADVLAVHRRAGAQEPAGHVAA